MKLKFTLVLFALVALSCKQASPGKQGKTEEKVIEKVAMSNNWIVLFDGTSFEDWRGYLKDSMPSSWSIEDGAMKFVPNKKESGNIITQSKYTNFILTLEWKISEGGNSGVFWGVHENSDLGQPYQTGPEIQVLDNERHPDAQANPKYHQAGALYDMVQPSKDVCKPAGEWNTYEIKIDHNVNEGSVKLNGILIVEFPVHGQAWNDMVSKSKFKDWKHFGKYATGHIGLQDHGDIVWYRNIKIKEL